MTPQTAIARLVAGAPLSRGDLESVLAAVLAGAATDAQVAALLVALRMRGESVDDIVAVAEALRSHMVPVPDVPADAVDTCGTGGDGAGTFNVSTAAALVVAGAGVPVAKHGNRAVSGRVGSADVVEALGVPLELGPAALSRCVREAGIAFLYAPSLHPAMKAVARPRRELGIRTVFNLAGPLANPAGVRRQVVGVAEECWVEPMAQALVRLQAVHAWVVHGHGGLDELALDGPSRVAEVVGRRIAYRHVDPQALGLVAAPSAALRVHDVDESASTIRAVLRGEPGPARDIVCLNAGATLVVAGVVPDLGAGVDRARSVLDGGRAAAVLERLREVAQGQAGG